jgi:hypothetical protein
VPLQIGLSQGHFVLLWCQVLFLTEPPPDLQNVSNRSADCLHYSDFTKNNSCNLILNVHKFVLAMHMSDDLCWVRKCFFRSAYEWNKIIL